MKSYVLNQANNIYIYDYMVYQFEWEFLHADGIFQGIIFRHFWEEIPGRPRLDGHPSTTNEIQKIRA